MPNFYTKNGFGSTGALSFTGNQDSAQLMLVSNPGSLTRIRSIVIASTPNGLGAPVNGLQVPVTVVRGGAGLGGSNGQSSIWTPLFATPNFGLPLLTDLGALEILFEKNFNVRAGDCQASFSPNELSARDGQKLFVVMTCAFDGSGTTTSPVFPTVQALTVLGDDISGPDAAHALTIGGNRGDARSLPRYDVER